MAKRDSGHLRLVGIADDIGKPLADDHIGPDFDGGGGGPVDPKLSMKDYIDARDEAVESRLFAKLDSLPTANQMWSAVGVLVATLLTVVGLIFGILAFGSDRFNGGLSVSPAISAAEDKQKLIDQEQGNRMDALNEKLDVIIQQTAKPRTAPQ